MKWIKKWNLIAALAAVGLIWLLLVLFLDPLIKRALIGAGQAAAGAKVEIGSVKTKLLRGSFVVSRVTVADKNAPMKNLVEFEKADLAFSPSAALRGKGVVDDASVAGIRFGTPRKTSGALPFAGPSAFERMVGDQLTPAKAKAESGLAKAKEVSAKLDPEKLKSKEAMDEAKKRLDDLSKRAKDRAGVEKIEARVKELEGRVSALQKGGNSAPEVARKAAEAAKVQQDIRNLLQEVDATKSSIQADYDKVKTQLARADELRKKDLQGLMAEAGLPSLDAESMTRRLIGPAAAQKLSTALYWVRWARKRQAKSQAERLKDPPVPRKGVDVEFPVKNALPAFLLRRASLDARVEDLFQGQAMDLKGELLGVNSNPPVYGKPTTLTLAGSAAGGITMSLNGLLDRTREDGPTEIRLRYAGFPLSGLALGDEGLSADVSQGVGRLDGTIKIVGDTWKGRVNLDADGVKLSPKVALSGAAGKLTESALKSVKRFTATIGIEGVGDDLHLSLTSDLGRTLADAAKSAATAELTARRHELEAKLDAALGTRASELHARAGDLQNTLLGPLDKQSAALQDQLRRAVARAVPSQDLKKKLPGDLKKIFK